MTELLKCSKQAPLLVAVNFNEQDLAKRQAFELDMLHDLMSVIDNVMPLLHLL
ncbi:uncharacterized protein LAESUDRAFT_765595 [Laetiporus sulphureus 93-53]|uniref:Uncharacterized protein n=1 Tax=Laetiporus sulphureus 93-53 TaxID=1314785 RepID=A0A165APA3_9APHY|nr:uncharacterized protein LAESUDRAFT_765595 [Laetiporus sulphureus 93-53]KZS99393.1 hypothetical protein LAESUDRAFT_765595 [Laetiporus sulphureus 93-53]